MEKKLFFIPCACEMQGTAIVEANSMDEAKQIARIQAAERVPDDMEMVDGDTFRFLDEPPYFVTSTGRSISFGEAREIKDHYMRICHNEDIVGKFGERFGDMAEHIGKDTICTATDRYERSLDNSDEWNYPAGDAIEECEKEALHDIAYALYQQDWMKSHGYTPEDMNQLRAEHDDLYEREITPDDGEFERYLLDHGFGGEIFACRAEFLEEEFLDAEYMRRLLGDEAEIFDLWKTEVGITCDWD